MDIKVRLEAEHSKSLTTAIVNYIGGDKPRFKVLMQLFLQGEYRLMQRAAWPLSYVCRAHPQLVKPYIAKLIQKLGEPGHHPAITRNILRIFQDLDIPEKDQAVFLDICFKFIRGAAFPAAIRAFAITCASGICKQYPELKQELLLVLKELEAHPQPPAIRQRIKLARKEL